MALIHVSGTGLNAAAWRHWINSSFADVLQAFNACNFGVSGLLHPGGVGLSGSSHKLVVLPLGPRNVICVLQCTWHSVGTNSAVHPSSTSVAINIREHLLNPSNAHPWRAPSGIMGSGSVHS